MKKHTINVRKKNDVMGQEDGTVIPDCHTDREPGAGESRDREMDGVDGLPACQPGEAPSPVSDSIRPMAVKKTCNAGHKEMKWGGGLSSS